MNVIEAIRYANSLLPGTPAPEGETDPRWQTIIDVAEFIPTNPEEVWSFITRWGIHADPDVRSAVATCLLEHMLELHFDLVFPRVELPAQRSKAFARTFTMCYSFGQSLETSNAHKIADLRKALAASPKKTRHSR